MTLHLPRWQVAAVTVLYFGLTFGIAFGVAEWRAGPGDEGPQGETGASGSEATPDYIDARCAAGMDAYAAAANNVPGARVPAQQDALKLMDRYCPD